MSLNVHIKLTLLWASSPRICSWPTQPSLSIRSTQLWESRQVPVVGALFQHTPAGLSESWMYSTQQAQTMWCNCIARCEELPLPTKLPYVAFIGNLAFDIYKDVVVEYFAPSPIKDIKIIKDREDQPKDFGYVKFEMLDSSKDVLARTGGVGLNWSISTNWIVLMTLQQLVGCTVRVSIAEPHMCYYQLWDKHSSFSDSNICYGQGAKCSSSSVGGWTLCWLLVVRRSSTSISPFVSSRSGVLWLFQPSRTRSRWIEIATHSIEWWLKEQSHLVDATSSAQVWT